MSKVTPKQGILLGWPTFKGGHVEAALGCAARLLAREARHVSAGLAWRPNASHAMQNVAWRDPNTEVRFPLIRYAQPDPSPDPARLPEGTLPTTNRHLSIGHGFRACSLCTRLRAACDSAVQNGILRGMLLD